MLELINNKDYNDIQFQTNRISKNLKYTILNIDEDIRKAE